MAPTGTASANTLLDLLFDDAAVGRCLVAPDGSVLRVNREWLRSTGFSLDQVLGASVIDLFPDARDMALAMHARAGAGHTVQVPRRARIVGGRETWWEGAIAPVPMEGGTGLLITAREVAPSAGSRADVERALRREREFTSALLDTVAALVVVLDLDGNIVRFNRACEAATGYAAAEVLGRSVFDVFMPSEELPGVRCVFERLRAGELPSHYQNRWRLKDGTQRLFAWENTFVADESGRVALVIATGTDVDARERAAQELHDTTALLRAISDTSADVIFAKDREGRMRFANPATLALVGKPLHEVIGKTDADFLGDKDAARRVMENDRRIMERGEPVELEEHVPLPDGTSRVWLSRKVPYRDAAGDVVGLLGISRDITDRKRAEEALRDAEERYRSLFTNMTEGFALGEAIWDEAGAPCDLRFLEMNDAFERHTGLDRSEVQGRSLREVLPRIEKTWIDRYCEVALTGRPDRFESYNRDLDRHFSVVSYRPAPGRFATIFTDVTERKRAEEALREANERLREADRRKDEFLGMLSHELRNPLAPIRNALYILERAEPAGPQARRAQGVANRQIAHLTRLVDDLLDVTRIARGKIELRRTELDLATLARRTAEDHRALMQQRGLDLGVEVTDEPLVVSGDETRLAQVLGNLLSNAAKFTPAGGRVTLAAGAEGGRAVLHVRDTGPGIDPAMLRDIFEPFTQAQQTLARSEGGLGLGLALVKGLVALHGGEVAAVSGGEGKGADFVVAVPLLAPGAARGHDGTDERRAAGPRRRVLVVDDNRDAADTLAQIVEMLGHEAEVAYDGPSAVAIARARPPEVVLCDIGLPGMDGYAVARAMRASAASGVRLFAVSGYAQPEDVATAVAAGFDGHVAKPPDVTQIERLLA